MSRSGRVWVVGLFAAVLLALTVIPARAADADSKAQSPVQKVSDFYDQGMLDRAELEALRLLNHPQELTPVERADLHRILAFIAVARDDPQLGRQHFLQALRDNPQMHLDRNLTSPKILAVFDEARADFKQVRINEQEVSASELHAYRLRFEGGKRSLLLPGLGQMHKGERTRGIVLMSAAGAAAAGLIYSQAMLGPARDDYLASTIPSEAESNYEHYRTLWKMRNGFGYALAAVWAGAALDAFLTAPPEKEAPSISLGAGIGGDGTSVMAGLRIRF